MRLFSILQTGLLLRFQFGERPVTQTLDFSQHAEDSSIVRLRVTPPSDGNAFADDATALELEFDRNGRLRSERQWPMKYPAWDQRTPEEIEKAFAEAMAVAEAASEPVEPAPAAGKKARK